MIGSLLSARRLELATIAFLAAAMALGATLPGARPAFAAAIHSPFLATSKPFVSVWTIVSGASLGACVAAAVLLLRRPRWIAVSTFLLALASRAAANVSRRGPDELAYPFTGPERHNEYIAAVPVYRADPAGFLRDYPHLIHILPEHAAGHPPGPTLIAGLLAQVGLPGAWPEVVLVLVLGAATAPLTWLLARALLDEPTALLAAVVWMFAPSVLIESATSMDAVFAFAATGAALLCVRGRVVLGSAAAAAATFLSYALAAVPAWAALVVWRRRGLGPAVRLAAGAALAAVVLYGLLWAASGYDPIAAYRATGARYFHGAGHRRPYWYWLFADAAAFGLALGLPTLFGLVRSIATRFAPALALAAIVAVASVSGYTKAEVERIWLFMTPLAAVAAAPAMRTARPEAVLALLAAQALAVEILYRTPW